MITERTRLIDVTVGDLVDYFRQNGLMTRRARRAAGMLGVHRTEAQELRGVQRGDTPVRQEDNSGC